MLLTPVIVEVLSLRRLCKFLLLLADGKGPRGNWLSAKTVTNKVISRSPHILFRLYPKVASRICLEIISKSFSKSWNYFLWWCLEIISIRWTKTSWRSFLEPQVIEVTERSSLTLRWCSILYGVCWKCWISRITCAICNHANKCSINEHNSKN